MGVEDDESSRTLYCGNLHERVTEELLYELFIQAGPLEKVKLVTGKSFSFITFRHQVSVPYTIELMSGIKLFGRNLKLQYRSRPDAGMAVDNPYQRSMSAPDLPRHDVGGYGDQMAPVDAHRQRQTSRFEHGNNSQYNSREERYDRHGRSRRDRESEYRNQGVLQASIQAQLANARALENQQMQFLQAQQLIGYALPQMQPWQQQPQQQHQRGRRWNYQ